MTGKCPQCASARLEAGAVFGAGVTLERASAFRKAIAAPEIKATVCLDCGAIFDLRAEPQKLAKLLGK